MWYVALFIVNRWATPGGGFEIRMDSNVEMHCN
jgi:hypothetical protein